MLFEFMTLPIVTLVILAAVLRVLTWTSLRRDFIASEERAEWPTAITGTAKPKGLAEFDALARSAHRLQIVNGERLAGPDISRRDNGGCQCARWPFPSQRGRRSAGMVGSRHQEKEAIARKGHLKRSAAGRSNGHKANASDEIIRREDVVEPIDEGVFHFVCVDHVLLGRVIAGRFPRHVR